MPLPAGGRPNPRPPRRRGQGLTSGRGRSSILVALANALVLMLVTGGVAWEALDRLLHPTDVSVAGWTMIVVSAIGIGVNGFSALLFAAGSKDDLNIRGAFLHLMADALTSLAVVVAGALVLLTGQHWIDPAISLAIAVLVVVATWSLLRDSLDMALDAVPRQVSASAVETYLRGLPGIADIHDLHIWPLSTTEVALTVHLVREGAAIPVEGGAQSDTVVLENVVTALRERFGIVHPTVQIEAADYAPLCHLSSAHTV
ncbi:MAG: cation diffusion facilitator family transporter [Acetobacter sp.]|uniref:cation diffusion facilitator family transporter n=1 Tax=Acetobacter sp. TaxID=440 RepID=UPI0039E8A34E